MLLTFPRNILTYKQINVVIPASTNPTVRLILPVFLFLILVYLYSNSCPSKNSNRTRISPSATIYFIGSIPVLAAVTKAINSNNAWTTRIIIEIILQTFAFNFLFFVLVFFFSTLFSSAVILLLTYVLDIIHHFFEIVP